MLASALKYAECGWPVFPIHTIRDGRCTCGFADCQNRGKHPRIPKSRGGNGLDDATTDFEQIRRWWRTYPGANIGVPTGAASGFVVLDVDPRHGGDESLAELRHKYGDLPHTVQAVTGSGGAHYLFKREDEEIGNTTEVGGMEGLDFRGDGGYIVVPPSLHESGRVYEWETSSRPFETTPLERMPLWLAHFLRQRRKSASLPEHVIEGARNDTLTSLAGSMRRRGMSEDGIYAGLMAENKSRCRPPLEESEVRRIAESVARYKPEPPQLKVAPPPPDGAEDVEYLDLERISREGIPPIKWLLPGWIVFKDVALFAGGGGIGKSTTAAAIALAVASGSAWCDLAPVRPCRVLYYDEEQDEDTTARLFLRLGKPIDNLKVASGQGIRLDTPEGVQRLENQIILHRPDIVFLDSIQQTFGTAKENDATEIGGIYATMFRLRNLYGTTFVLLHHKRKTQPGQGQTEALELVRGSTAHGTQASTVWYAYQSDDPTILNLTQAKRRGAPKQSLRVRYTEDDDRIQLEAGGAVEDADTVLAQVSEWVVNILSERSEIRMKDLVELGKTDNHSKRSIERALKHLRTLGNVAMPRRGVYTLILAESLAELAEDDIFAGN